MKSRDGMTRTGYLKNESCGYASNVTGLASIRAGCVRTLLLPLARASRSAHLGTVPTPKDQRQTMAVIILGIAALLLIANVLPPLVAIAAQSERKK
jgi:hypothetical protein